MRRTIAGFAVVAGLALLAACGGGGGSTPPVTSPSSNPGPSSHPSSTPSPGPSPTASTTPTPTPKSSKSPGPTPTPSSKPTATPTAKPTATPTAKPTATPTAKPTTTPAPTPNPSSTPNRTMTLHAGDGSINGTDDLILSSAPNTHRNTGEGDLEPGDPGALPGGGGQGSAVDPNESFPWGNGIPTATTMSNNYHVHAFLGLYVNGQEVAIPDGIGMVNPFGDFQGTDPNGPSYCASAAPDINFECYADQFYYIHTHTPDGLIHMEATAPVCGSWQQPPAAACPTIFTLGNVLDVWGVSISPNNFGPFSGPVTIYTSPPGVFNPCSGSSGCYTGSNTYSLYTGDPRQIPLNSHTVVWILVGSGNPTGSSLPNIEWYAAH